MDNINTSLSAFGLAADGHDPLKDIQLARQPPPGFDYRSATHDELLEYGLPPPPDKSLFPEQYRQWEHIFSKASMLATEASIKTISEHSQTVHGLALLSRQQYTLGTAGSDNFNCWAGASVDDASADDADIEAGYGFVDQLNQSTENNSVFGMVSASWTVARPYPPSSSRKANSWVDGDFEASTWVGIDGSTPLDTDASDTSSEPSSLLCAGIAHHCLVRDGVMEFATYPWVAWHPLSAVEVSGFPINPGDLITVTVSLHAYARTHQKPLTSASVTFYNQSTSTYLSGVVSLRWGKFLIPNTARWIVQCASPPQQATMPFLGTNFIHDCWFLTNTGKKDLGDAVFTNVVADGGKDLLLQATRETNSVLRVSSQSRPDDTLIRKTRSPRVVVYYQSTAPISPLAYVPVATGRSPAVTHVNISSFYFEEDHDTHEIWLTLNGSKSDDTGFDSLWKDVKTLQVHDIKVLAMLGGENKDMFSRLDKDPDSDAFKKAYGAIKALIDTYNLDGVDLNVEEEVSQTGINNLIDRFVADFGKDFLISLAPVAIALKNQGTTGNRSGFNYKTLEAERGDKIAWYNAQFYKGWGSMKDPRLYNEIVQSGFKSWKVVARVRSSPGSAYVDLDTLKKTLEELVEKYGSDEFGGVAGWEYKESNPDPMQPWEWAQVMRDTLG